MLYAYVPRGTERIDDDDDDVVLYKIVFLIPHQKQNQNHEYFWAQILDLPRTFGLRSKMNVFTRNEV